MPSLVPRLLFVVAVLATQPVSAHHSFDGEFDRTKPITLTGTISKVEWTNPHGRLFVDVKASDGVVNTWEIELGTINAMMRSGWTRNTFKTGDTVTIDGFLARHGSHLASASQFGCVTLADRKASIGGACVPPPGSTPGR
jgi:Family of unknown function (DUF6152)